MKEIDAINYLEKIERGTFLTINIPLAGDKNIPVTSMYLGKDKDGRYNFADSGKFMFSKEFIERGKISIDKEYDGDIAIDIYAKVKKEIERNKKKSRDAR